MAQMKPGFITGANAKLKMFGKTMAYCGDVAYNISVATVPIESIGKYEVHSNEPIAYSVDGSFSVIRYTSRARLAADGGIIKDADDNGNAPQRIGNTTSDMGKHLDPAQLLASETFDLEIIEKSASGEKAVFTVKDCRLTRRGMSLNKRGVMTDGYAYVGVLATDEDITTKVSNSGSKDLS